MARRKIRPNTVIALSILTALVASPFTAVGIVVMLTSSFRRGETFDDVSWSMGRKHCNEHSCNHSRAIMVDDLVENQISTSLTKEDVVKLLGPAEPLGRPLSFGLREWINRVINPERNVDWKKDATYHYFLGNSDQYESEFGTSREHTKWLVVKFDSSDHVQKTEVVKIYKE